MSHAIRGILFDKDGTLFDFHAIWLPCILANETAGEIQTLECLR